MGYNPVLPSLKQMAFYFFRFAHETSLGPE